MDERTLARFKAGVERRGADECWPWRRKIDRRGYGRFSIKIDGKWKWVYAHRFAFFVEHGFWGNVNRHTCDNPPCCNPAHLLDGTHADNMRDVVARGRRKGIVGAFGDGASNGKPLKFSEALVREIRKTIAEGPRGTAAALARKYRVQSAYISEIKTGRLWRHTK